MGGDRWVMVYEGDADGCLVTAVSHLQVGQSVDAGREGELAIGVEAANRQVSRWAAVVTPTERGWRVDVTNRNGAVLHRWAQAPELAAPTSTVNWPLVGLRMLPDSGSTQHWLLLEADDLAVRAGSDAHGPGGTATDLADRPGELPQAEREALLTVFAGQLRWPPHRPTEPPMLLKQAAARLGITISGVQERLRAARSRALRVGLDREVGLTDPSYLYILARAGYLQPPADRPHRPH